MRKQRVSCVRGFIEVKMKLIHQASSSCIFGLKVFPRCFILFIVLGICRFHFREFSHAFLCLPIVHTTLTPYKICWPVDLTFYSTNSIILDNEGSTVVFEITTHGGSYGLHARKVWQILVWQSAALLVQKLWASWYSCQICEHRPGWKRKVGNIKMQSQSQHQSSKFVTPSHCIL